MNTLARSREQRALFSFPFFNVRNISCPEDTDNGRKVYIGHAPIRSIIGLSTDENVRSYLLDAEGKQRRRPTQVHKAIQNTLTNTPENFSVLNSGIVIVAHDCEIDEKEKLSKLKKPSIINGSQTQGVIRDYFEDVERDGLSSQAFTTHVKFEIVVTSDDALIAEISIARNFQNDVMTLSIAGRRGQLEELEKRLKSKDPYANLQTSETQLSDDYVKTERLLQVIAALIPEKLWWPKAKEFNKVYAYSMKAKCLKEFQEIYQKAKDPNDPDHQACTELYQFYLDVAPQALELYEKWKTHQGFQGTGLRAIEREGREIREVPDGIIFPILSALSAFARRTKSGWRIEPPALFTDDELIRAAKSVYTDIANHNPWNMGKSKSCYASLYQITRIFKRLSK
jgi:hypothetical protein